MILLVEEDFATRRALDEFLTGEGFQVLCTASGSEGLDVLDSYALRPRLVILDIKDPLRFRSLQGALPAARDIPVIVIVPEPDDREVLKLEATRVLRRPLDRAALLESVEQCLGSAEVWVSDGG